MKILYDNKLFGSTITASSETYRYEVSNITGINSLKTWRSSSTTANIVFELNAGIQPDMIAFKNHNLTNSATIKIQGNATDTWGSPSVDVTLTWRDDIVIGFFTSGTTYTFWRLYIDDPTNTDSYVEVGTIYLGTALEMPGMTPTQTLTWNTNSIVEFSLSNQPFGDDRADFDTFSIESPVLTNTERKSIKTMHSDVKNITPVFLAVWEDDLDFEDPEYCNIVGTERGSQKDSAGNFSINLQFRGVQ